MSKEKSKILNKRNIIIIFLVLITAFMYRNVFIYTYMHYTYEPKEVDGQLEPPFPSYSSAFGTIQGADVNKNGLRDDLEIFANEILNDLPYELREVTKLELKNWSLFTTQDMGTAERKKWWLDKLRIDRCFNFLESSVESPIELNQMFDVMDDLRDRIGNTSERQKAVDINRQGMITNHYLDINISIYNIVAICDGMKINLCKVVKNTLGSSNKWRPRSYQLQPKIYKSFYEKCHKK
ncbi:hypothetical protein A9Q84_00305 [Halobacteriovorax marinus]|uniref:Uncharacterized protein n=1 Tax=Halobacteriovorax marinus TaxID=97084 RepID=A0A1Y5FH20_9BACT|nr:hypothetical protein A9Q84_00305 [Halobacteriovorax marinus]